MRILHIVGSIDPRAGGVSEAIRALLHYGPSEIQQEVLSVDDPASPFLAELHVPVHAFGPATSTFAYSARLKPWLVANRHRFDAVFVHGLWSYCGFAAWRAFAGHKTTGYEPVGRGLGSFGAHVPYVVFPHGMLDPYFKRAFPLKHLKKWLFWVAAQYWILRDASSVVFTCTAEAQLARQTFWLHRWKPYVVAFGATGPIGNHADLRQAFLSSFPALQNKRFLLFLSRIHPKKGCDLLLNAFIRAAVLDPDLHLVMVGPDPQDLQQQLMQPVRAAGLEDRIHWTGMLQGDIKWGAFLAAEAFILPSHQENFGLAVAEALACGLPVLLSDKINIAPDITADGAGLMETDTPEGTLRLLKRWIATPAKRRAAIAQQALNTFQQRYDMRTNAAAILRLLKPEPAQQPTQQP